MSSYLLKPTYSKNLFYILEESESNCFTGRAILFWLLTKIFKSKGVNYVNSGGSYD